MLYIASDHGGTTLKKKIILYFEKEKIPYKDLSPTNTKTDDYPDIAKKVVKEVKNSHKGILICGTGTGMVMAANRYKGIRAALVYDNYSAKMARHDNNSNVICLRGRNFPANKALSALKIWLKTDFSKLARHKRRVKKLDRS